MSDLGFHTPLIKPLPYYLYCKMFGYHRYRLSVKTRFQFHLHKKLLEHNEFIPNYLPTKFSATMATLVLREHDKFNLIAIHDKFHFQYEASLPNLPYMA